MLRDDEDEFFATWIYKALEKFTSKSGRGRDETSCCDYVERKCEEKYGSNIGWKCLISNEILDEEKELKSCFRFDLDVDYFVYVYRC